MSDTAWNRGPRHWRDRGVTWAARRIVRPQLGLPAPWWLHRSAFRAGAALRRRPRDVTQTWTTLAARPALLHRPPTARRRLLWVHGGGFCTGSPATHAALCSHLALRLEALVIAPSYRRAPEHPFPAAYDDTLAALSEAERLEPDLGPMALGGDSAGGCLVMAAMATRLTQGARYDAVFLASPAALIDPDRPVPDTADDQLFPLSVLRRIGRDYAQGADPRDPRLSPAYADFTGAPPTLIHCVAGEYLELDSRALAQRLRDSGARVTLEMAKRMPHAFHYLVGTSPRADAAVARMGDFWDAL